MQSQQDDRHELDGGKAPQHPDQVDVLVVGGGISGIDVAYRLQTECPGLSYALLEARDSIGGTWDLFKYPGLRSDSDMFTLGFPFEPWTGERSIAPGEQILQYIKDTARKHGIDQHIRTGHRVRTFSWSTPDARWDVDVDTADGPRRIHARYVYLASGYYDYHQAHRPSFPGEEDFGGTLVHPQFWPEDLDLAGRKVVVIGSGATAVTLVPALVERGVEQVTMLQRTPSYLLALPGTDPAAARLRGLMSKNPQRAHSITRWAKVLQTLGFYQFTRRAPGAATKILTAGPRRALKGSNSYDAKDFQPPYQPWDQRVCIIPDGDFFKVLRDGKARIVTDTIDRFVPEGIRTSSGQLVEADVIVTATGLSLQLAGGAQFAVDGTPIDLANHFSYRGCMLEGLPNLGLSIGYVNASWTLRADLVAQFFCKVVNRTENGGYAFFHPKVGAALDAKPILDLAAGYVQRSVAKFPKSGERAPWVVHQNYVRESFDMRRADLAEELVYSRAGEKPEVGLGTAPTQIDVEPVEHGVGTT